MEIIKKTILLFLVLISSKSVSQIYFGTNASMYVKNQVLYVTQDVNLSTNSNLYLRNNSQLVQGTTSTSTNTGAGTLSVYQEGTSDRFEYNYWCAPVGVASASSGNANFGITMLNRPTSSTAATAATILGAGIYDGYANPLSIASTWIYKLVNSNNYSQWVAVGSATTIAPGEGFTMKGTDGSDSVDPESTGITNNPGSAQRYDFRGKPNDGNITVTVGINNSTLTGNPYPSALHLNAFLLDAGNSASGGVAYFWEQDKTVNSHYLTAYKGGYGSYSPGTLGSNGVYVPATFNSYTSTGALNTTGTSSGLVIERKYSPIGQGFIINATASGTLTFKNSHRAYYQENSGLSKFEKPAKTAITAKSTETNDEIVKISHFKLNTIINNQFTRQLALAFLPEATDGVDFGIDALNIDEDLPNDVSFSIENGNYVIQGVTFDPSKRIPLTVKVTSNSTFKFYVPEVVNFDSSETIYLYDGLDSSYHDIKNGTYEVTVSPGTYSDRFKITFSNQTLGTPEAGINNFFISQDNANNNLKASNPNHLTITSFRLYDMLGRVVLSKKDLGSDPNYVFSTTILSQGVYIAE
ncbi:MAG: secretion protein, partial [Flavobacterium sp.]